MIAVERTPNPDDCGHDHSTEAEAWACAAASCSGGVEAHEAHMELNDECPWCGVHR